MYTNSNITDLATNQKESEFMALVVLLLFNEKEKRCAKNVLLLSSSQ